MRYMICRPGLIYYSIDGARVGGDDLEAVRQQAEDIASEPWNLVPMSIWDYQQDRVVLKVEPRSSARFAP